MNFTNEQLQAIQHSGNIAISAGAGSGKTRVLVEKYFKILIDDHPDWPVESVVAITFTVKAAAELKHRIITKLLSEMNKEDPSSLRYSRMRQVRREIIGAPIGTIHSFCSRILKTFPFEAKLNPDFSVVEEAHKVSLVTQSVKRGISQIVQDSSLPEHDDLLTLLTLFKKSAIIKQLEQMMADRSRYLSAAKYITGTPQDIILDELKNLIDEAVFAFSEGPLRNIEKALKALIVASNGGPFGRECEAILNEFFSSPEVKIKELYDAFETRLLTKTSLSPRKKLLNKDVIDEDHPEIKNLVDNLKRLPIGMARPVEAIDVRAMERTARLARIFLYCHEIYTKMRGADAQGDEADLLDFSDLELRTHDLMNTQPSVVRKLQSSIHYLIIDEFQDTSEMQWSILGKIVSDLNTNQLLKSKLFIVGDPKQGVYGFRNANILLFDRLSRQIRESGGYVVMTKNFRTVGVPLGFVNKVFEKLLNLEGNRFAVEFEPLIVGRENKNGEVAKDKGRVEIIVSAPEEVDATEESLVNNSHVELTRPDFLDEEESEIVARSIDKKLRSGMWKPGDIAILFRRRRHFFEYERALQKRNIPCVVQTASGLFHQPEISDFVALLYIILFPSNDLYALQFLRGMYGNLADETLLRISRCEGRWFIEKLRNAAHTGRFELNDEVHVIPAADLEEIRFLHSVVTEVSKLADVVNIDVLVSSALNLLGASVIAKAGPRGERASANLELLKEIAYKFRNEDLADFLYYIESEENIDRGTEEAPFDETVNAVKLMTIHASKGLEFPVVYVPTLGVPLISRSQTLDCDGEKWMSLTASTLDAGNKPLINAYLRFIEKQKFIAEEKRLLYVAFTRCREELIISAEKTNKETFGASDNTAYSWLEPILEESYAGCKTGYGYVIGETVEEIFESDISDIPETVQVEEPGFNHARENARINLLKLQQKFITQELPRRLSAVSDLEKYLLSYDTIEFKRMLEHSLLAVVSHPDMDLSKSLISVKYPAHGVEFFVRLQNGLKKFGTTYNNYNLRIGPVEKLIPQSRGVQVLIKPSAASADQSDLWYFLYGNVNRKEELLNECSVAASLSREAGAEWNIRAFDLDAGEEIELPAVESPLDALLKK